MAFHRSVMVRELLDCLDLRPGGLCLDATVGGGGHAVEVLRRVKSARLIGLDVDEEAVMASEKVLSRFSGRAVVLQRNYADLRRVLDQVGWGEPDAVYFDLGVSGHQIDCAGRGFSYQSDGPLDMRMDRRSGTTAADLVNRLDPGELKRLFMEYGEEPRSGRVAEAIAERRSLKPIRQTGELAELVRAAAGGGIKPLSRIFQALRIRVNSELDNLRTGLQAALEALVPGGTMVVIAYHSLEDRIVKDFISGWERGCICPPDWPACRCGRTPKISRPFRRPLRPGEDEVRVNTRARSARMRAAVKLQTF